MLAVGRVKSLASSQRSAPVKRHRISDEVQLELGGDNILAAVPESGSSELRHYFSCFSILANMWGIAGCFNVGTGEVDTKYCHWQEACDYVAAFKEKG